MEPSTYSLQELKEAIYQAKSLISKGFDDLIDLPYLKRLETEVKYRSLQIRLVEQGDNART